MPFDFEDFKPQFNRLIESSEEFAVATVRLAERMNGINERMTRMEDVQENMLKDFNDFISTIQRRGSCPYKREIERLELDAAEAKSEVVAAKLKVSDFIEKDHAELMVTATKNVARLDQFQRDTDKLDSDAKADRLKLSDFIEKDHADLVSTVKSIHARLAIVGAMALAAMGGTVYAIVAVLLRNIK